jgi:cytochrome P450
MSINSIYNALSASAVMTILVWSMAITVLFSVCLNPKTMSVFCPVYPTPRKSKIPPWRAFFSARHSWLDTLYERSYSMQMGQVSLLNSTLFMVNEPTCVHQVLSAKVDNYPKHSLLGEALRPLLGESIFTTNGAQWQRQRQMMNPSFAQARIHVAFEHMQQATLAMLQRIAQWDLKASHDVQEEMTHVTADVIFRTIFSKSINSEHASEIFAAFTEYQELSPRLTLPLVYGFKWLSPFWLRKRSDRAAQRIREHLLAIIAPRFAQRDLAAQDAPSDILGSLLLARDETTGKRFELNELLDQVAMLFLAGHETSASALSWALHLLSHSPTIQERMFIEIQHVVGTETLKADHIKALELTWNIFRETLRLFPPVGFFARGVNAADSMRDKNLKKGDSVVIAPWLIHRHKGMWERPDEFDPDRFSQPAGKASAKEAYLPFSAGPRICIGAAFAHQEAVVILSYLVRHYKIEPAIDHTPMPVGRLTIRSANGILVHLTPR